MAVKLSQQLIFEKVAEQLDKKYYAKRTVIYLASPETDYVCRHGGGWFSNATEYRLKRWVGYFNREASVFEVYGRENLEWGKKFAENLSSALGKDILLELDENKMFDICPGGHDYNC